MRHSFQVYFLVGVTEFPWVGKAKAKYRGLSAAAAKCAAFGRDDGVVGWLRRTNNCNC